jgi:DNA-binding NarL/FixJ family response regulator
MAGELTCSPRIAAQLLRRAAHRPAIPGDDVSGTRLTSREQQVFGYLQQGRSNKEEHR